MLLRRLAVAATVLASFSFGATSAWGRHPDGASIVRVMGPRAAAVFAPTVGPAAGRFGALVSLPPGVRAEALGLQEIAPGIGRLQGGSRAILSFAEAHPELEIEVAPPVLPRLDRASAVTRAAIARQQLGVDGTGVLIGIADTGLDVSHPDFRDSNGRTRVAWMIDYSLAPVGEHPELEDKYGLRDEEGKVVAGAVFSAADIDVRLGSSGALPQDEIGHGSHVTSIAAGNGGPSSPYVGIAPNAGIVFARVSAAGSDAIANDALVAGVAFMFDRADALGRPMVANLSLGSDFGPHDGTMLWEQVLASYVGPTKPGRALVVAAGNSGSIAESPVHQGVYVTEGSTVRVPVVTHGARRGGVQIWVTMRGDADLRVGLEAPDGEWISPVADGDERGKNGNGFNAGVIHGSRAKDSPIPDGSRGAVVLWQGAWPAGVYYVTLEGRGQADLFLQATGDAANGGGVGFAGGVREGTINLPGTHPSIIAVGCTVNRARWTSISGGDVTLRVPLLDPLGGKPHPSQDSREIEDGEVCWFSSAGPTVTGVQKPEIAAPGALVIAAMSKQAVPGNPGSVFTNPFCPPLQGETRPDPRCLQIDDTHAVALGTSMSAPMVAGTVALLLQREPGLTQDKILALLQAGAHPFRGAAWFQDQSGPGELDVAGTLDALEQMQDPRLHLPSAGTSWLTLSTEYASADGSTPITAIVELRTEDGAHRADMFEGSRLQAYAILAGSPLPIPPLVRRGPGVWFTTFRVPPGYGGSTLKVGATFDGADIVRPRTIPVATDAWSARYPPRARGGCAVVPASEKAGAWGMLVAAGALAWGARRRRDRALSST